jgi:hypothetical protein
LGFVTFYENCIVISLPKTDRLTPQYRVPLEELIVAEETPDFYGTRGFRKPDLELF